MSKTKEMPRSKRIGSADIASLIGLEDAFGSPYSVWHEKTHGSLVEENDAMRWGKRLEPLILEEYSLHDLAGQIVSTQAHHTYADWPVASATLDAVAIAGERFIAVEAKTTRDFKWNEVPALYQAQVQWQMGVSGLTEAHVAVLFKPTTRFEVYAIPFDKGVFRKMIDLAREFWEKHVLTGIPPEADGHPATTEALKQIEATDEVAEIDWLADQLSERGQLAQSIKALEERKALIDNQVKAALGNASTGLIGGKIAVKFGERSSSRFDQKSFAADHPALAAKYKVSSTYRVMTVRKEFSGVEGGDE